MGACCGEIESWFQRRGKTQYVMGMLHQAHPGISCMKILARCYVWSPGIDKDVEQCVKSCDPCQ